MYRVELFVNVALNRIKKICIFICYWQNGRKSERLLFYIVVKSKLCNGDLENSKRKSWNMKLII